MTIRNDFVEKAFDEKSAITYEVYYCEERKQEYFYNPTSHDVQWYAPCVVSSPELSFSPFDDGRGETSEDDDSKQYHSHYLSNDCHCQDDDDLCRQQQEEQPEGRNIVFRHNKRHPLKMFATAIVLAILGWQGRELWWQSSLTPLLFSPQTILCWQGWKHWWQSSLTPWPWPPQTMLVWPDLKLWWQSSLTPSPLPPQTSIPVMSIAVESVDESCHLDTSASDKNNNTKLTGLITSAEDVTQMHTIPCPETAGDSNKKTSSAWEHETIEQQAEVIDLETKMTRQAGLIEKQTKTDDTHNMETTPLETSAATEETKTERNISVYRQVAQQMTRAAALFNSRKHDNTNEWDPHFPDQLPLLLLTTENYCPAKLSDNTSILPQILYSQQQQAAETDQNKNNDEKPSGQQQQGQDTPVSTTHWMDIIGEKIQSELHRILEYYDHQ